MMKESLAVSHLSKMMTNKPISKTASFLKNHQNQNLLKNHQIPSSLNKEFAAANRMTRGK